MSLDLVMAIRYKEESVERSHFISGIIINPDVGEGSLYSTL
jgi:hypothetical protein